MSTRYYEYHKISSGRDRFINTQSTHVLQKEISNCHRRYDECAPLTALSVKKSFRSEEIGKSVVRDRMLVYIRGVEDCTNYEIVARLEQAVVVELRT